VARRAGVLRGEQPGRAVRERAQVLDRRGEAYRGGTEAGLDVDDPGEPGERLGVGDCHGDGGGAVPQTRADVPAAVVLIAMLGRTGLAHGVVTGVRGVAGVRGGGRPGRGERPVVHRALMQRRRLDHDYGEPHRQQGGESAM
jgi:hypothetical protein